MAPLMLGPTWAKRLLFGGGRKGCRRSQQHNGEIACFSEKVASALIRVKGGMIN